MVLDLNKNFDGFGEKEARIGRFAYPFSPLSFNVDRTIKDRAWGRYSIYPWVGRCSPASHTPTLFKTNITDFPTLFKTELRFLIPCLRHLSCGYKKLCGFLVV